jgi:D-apionolactonase
VDLRQLSLFAAGWTLASIARLATTGFVHSLTYYETTGWRGVMETEAGSLLPVAFPSEPGMVFPIFHVLADIAEFGPCQVLPTHSTHPLQADGLTLRNAAGVRRVFAINFTRDEQLLKLKSGSGSATVRYLDETNVREAMLQPEAFRARPVATVEAAGGKIEVRLTPYAVARVDLPA